MKKLGLSMIPVVGVALMLAVPGFAYGDTATNMHGASSRMSTNSDGVLPYGHMKETEGTLYNGKMNYQNYHGTSYNGTPSIYDTNPYNRVSANMHANTYTAKAAATSGGGSNWGWLGLIGLLGLVGMRGRNPERQ